MTSKSNTTKRVKGKAGSSPSPSSQETIEQLKQIVLSVFIFAVAVIISFKGAIEILPNYPLLATSLHVTFIIVAAVNVYNRFATFFRE